MKDKRLQFAKVHVNWTIGDWKKVLWSDESPFQILSMPNRQNDRIWARNSNNIEPIVQMKFPAEIQVWGMMSHRALSELHIILPKQTINGAYYRDNILANRVYSGEINACWYVWFPIHAGLCPCSHCELDTEMVCRTLSSVLEEGWVAG